MAKKYIDVGRLRAEIEKLKEGVGIGLSEYEAGYHNGAGEVCNEILSVINSLQQEQPEVDLEKELADYCRRYYNYDYPKQAEEETGSSVMPHIIEAAKFFYELGQKDVANKYDEIEYNRQRAEEEMSNKTLDEAAEGYVQKGHLLPEAFLVIPTFKDGAKWQKAKMMKGAVEADVKLTLHDKTGDISLHTGYLPKELGIKWNDKVRIIIVKEEEKQ